MAFTIHIKQPEAFGIATIGTVKSAKRSLCLFSFTVHCSCSKRTFCSHYSFCPLSILFLSPSPFSFLVIFPSFLHPIVNHFVQNSPIFSNTYYQRNLTCLTTSKTTPPAPQPQTLSRTAGRPSTTAKLPPPLSPPPLSPKLNLTPKAPLSNTSKISLSTLAMATTEKTP